MGPGTRWPPEPEQDDDYPGWTAARAGTPDDEPGRGRAGQRAGRSLVRRRRRFYLMGGGALVAIVAIAAVLATMLLNPGGQTAAISDDLVTTFQPGELQQVPNSCDVITTATVQQYLPGKVKVAAPLPVDGKLESGCYWTVSKPPFLRLLNLNLEAYKYSGLASGDGSATDAAIDAYAEQLQSLQHPGKKSYTPKGSSTTILNNIGNQAFSSLQVFKTTTGITDVATVIIRFHNVIISAEMNGIDGTPKGGPVVPSQLEAAALAFAESALASLHA
jgi:hypothetical protein